MRESMRKPIDVPETVRLESNYEASTLARLDFNMRQQAEQNTAVELRRLQVNSGCVWRSPGPADLDDEGTRFDFGSIKQRCR